MIVLIIIVKNKKINVFGACERIRDVLKKKENTNFSI